MAPGMPLIIKRICAVRILSNLQFFTQVLKFESLALYRSLVRQVHQEF